MQNSQNRSVIVISGLLTVLVLGAAMLTLAFRNGWVQVPPTAPRGATDAALAQTLDTETLRLADPPRTDNSASTAEASAGQDELAAYRTKLDESYRALDEAYAQVRALQAAQSQAGPRREREHESEHREARHERESHRRDADDH